MNDDFETLLSQCRSALERFVYWRLPSRMDADDILQETLLTAYRRFDTLRNTGDFRPWLLAIARNKCNDYFRARARSPELPMDSLDESAMPGGCMWPERESAVSDTMELLGDRDKQMLYLYFFRNMQQSEIACRLGVPLGTVKSRLFVAKRNFRANYPRGIDEKEGEPIMKKLPEKLPEYKIIHSDKPPFPVVWEEVMGWFLVPKQGEKLSWGMYDLPSRKCAHVYDMKVTGRAEVHGIEGVELTARESDYSGKKEVIERTFVAQLTDTHCRFLASMRTENGIRRYITFLDGDAFLPNWGFGEDNCGNETHIARRGDITRNGDDITTLDKSFLLDIVGRYDVTICGHTYDTVCVMDVSTYNCGVVSEQYLDEHGRTVLWRRFNRDDWAIERYGRLWSEQLPDNRQITVNGITYVHWYDCITDYVL